MNIVEKIEYYLYRLRWWLGFRTHLDIELNNDCNHRCVMCWWGAPGGPGFEKGQMKLAQAVRYLIEGRIHGYVSVKCNFRGEPTLYKDLVHFVKKAKNLGYTDIMMNSNGVLMKDKFASLRDAGLTTIIISLGAIDKDAYSKLHKVKDKHYYRLHESLEYMHENQGNVKVKLNCHESKTSDFDYFWIKRKYPNFFIVKRHLMEREGEDLSIPMIRERKKMCPHLKRRMLITQNGKFYPCCMAYNEPDDILLGYNFEDALKNRKQLIKAYREGILLPSCVKCPSQDVYKVKVSI